jgi:hypothetical protein
MNSFVSSYIIYENTDNIIPLTFIALQDNCYVKLKAFGSCEIDQVQYKTNKNNQWLDYKTNDMITLSNIGDSVQFKDNRLHSTTAEENYRQFVLIGQIAAKGNVMSMQAERSFSERWRIMLF